MARVISIGEAREAAGLRIVSLPGVPSPWTEAAKGLFHVKGLEYVLARRGENEAADVAVQWLGDVGVPAVVYGREKARTGWAEILLLAERLAPEPALIPKDPEQRAMLFGLAHEICGEMGLGWAQRLVMITVSLQQGDEMGFPREVGEYLMPRYGYRPDSAVVASDRVIELLRMFSRRLDGHRYLMNDTLTALDIYLATFVNLIHPLPHAQMPMAEMARIAYSCRDPDILAACDDRIRTHQRFIYDNYLELPVQL